MESHSARTSGHRGAIPTLGIVLLTLLLNMPAALTLGATIHVPADQPTIQAGIDAAAAGDTVLVANGIYRGEGNRDIDFQGKAITVTSEGGANACIIDCGGIAENQFHTGFIFHQHETDTSVLQGFTIRNGNMATGSATFGGAIYCRTASPRIAWNIITGNQADDGGAIYCGYGAAPTIVGNIINGNRAYSGAGIHCGNNSSPHIALNTISGNRASEYWNGIGGGIYCAATSVPTIVGNRIVGNVANDHYEFPGRGGGIYCISNLPGEISQNEIRGNSAGLGGGIYIASERSELVNNVFIGNVAGPGGALLFEEGGTHTVNSCTFFANSGSQGGAICYNAGFTGPSPADDFLLIINSILWQNEAGYGSELYIGTQYGALPVWAEISYSDVHGGFESVYLEPDVALHWGPAMITEAPRFAAGPNGDHYLSQLDAGQAVQSPCVDTGDFAGGDVTGTTRTDGVEDTGPPDMGYHYRDPVHEPDTEIDSGPYWWSNEPLLVFTFDGRDRHGRSEGLQFSWKLDDGSWSAFSSARQAVLTGIAEGAHTFSVRARDSEGRIDETAALSTFFHEPWEAEDGWVNIVTGPGPAASNPPLVRTPEGEWLAYLTTRRGVNVACGNLDGGEAWEVVTGPGPGPEFGPHVRCWSMGGTGLAGGSFMAYGTPRYGVNVAAGDMDNDGFDEIVTGAGPGAVFGPHVRGWNHDGSGTVTAMSGVSFMAYGTHRWGVEVACGDIDGDGIDEIVTGAGPGAVFGPHVRGWNHDGGTSVEPVPGVSYFAYATPRYGVEVACGDIDGDGIDEILTAPGPGPPFAGHIRGWNVDGASPTAMSNVNFFTNLPPYGTGYGAKVSAGDVDLDGVDEILVMGGPDPEAGSQIRSYDVEAEDVRFLYAHSFNAYGAWMTCGGNIAGIRAD